MLSENGDVIKVDRPGARPLDREHPKWRTDYQHRAPIAQFRYIKIQPKTIDLSTRLVGITTEFVGFIPQSLVLRSIVLG